MMRIFFGILCAVALWGCDGKTQQNRAQTDDTRTLKNGVVIHYIQKGKGNPAIPGEFVQMDLEGMLKKDSSIFRSSIQQKKEMIYPVGEGTVCQGVEAALEVLVPGDEVWIEVPASQGFGSMGIGAIPPNSDLLYHVWLREVYRQQSPPKWDFSRAEKEDLKKGLEVWKVTEGMSPYARPGNTVLSHFAIYRAKDSVLLRTSYTDGRPAVWQVGVGQFPPGVEQVLTQSGKGGKFRVRVSGEQTYQRSQMEEIPSNMPLIIDMEVFGVK